MALEEIINKRLLQVDYMMEHFGMWNGEDYMTMIMPLHEALLIIAKRTSDDKSSSLVEGQGGTITSTF